MIQKPKQRDPTVHALGYFNCVFCATMFACARFSVIVCLLFILLHFNFDPLLLSLGVIIKID